MKRFNGSRDKENPGLLNSDAGPGLLNSDAG